ncbi:DUF6390 family protein [Patescibacteria group bacterium]
MKGLLMCAKYAFPPNLLNYCGPEDNKALFGVLKEGEKEQELRNLLSQFEGAVPYLRLIAQANKIKDEFDERVVEAYWIGNDLLKKVNAQNIFSHTEDRFKEKMDKKDWKWLVSGSVVNAKPFHGFHVFDIYRRTGLMKSGKIENLLETIDNCRIGWGRVANIDNGFAMVEYNPFEFKENKLCLGQAKTKKMSFLGISLKVGDEVSMHWDYICDKITPRQKNNLVFWTDYHLNLTNRTI